MESEIYICLNQFKTDLENQFPDLPIFIENRGDLGYETETALNKQGIYVLIRIPTLENNGNSTNKKISLNISSLLFQISENVTINRSLKNINTNSNYKTSCQDLAIEIVKFLSKKYNGLMTLVDIQNDFDSGLMSSTINYSTTMVLDI